MEENTIATEQPAIETSEPATPELSPIEAKAAVQMMVAAITAEKFSDEWLSDVARKAETAGLNSVAVGLLQKQIAKKIGASFYDLKRDWKDAEKNNKDESAEGEENKLIDHEAVARKIKKLVGDDALFDPKTAAWRIWLEGGTHWRTVEEDGSELRRLAVIAIEELGGEEKGQRNNGMVSNGIMFARDHLERRIEPTPGLISFTDGTYDAENDVWHDSHNKDHGLTWCVGYDFTQDGGYPTIESLLKQNIDDPAARTAIMEHFGLALLGDTSRHKSLVLYGPRRSGKSTILDLGLIIFGYQPKEYAAYHVFNRDTEALRWRKLHVNIPLACFDEFPSETLQNDELFKTMSTHSYVPIRGMSADPIMAKWRPKMLLAVNDAPRFSDPSGAVASRLLIVQVPHGRVDKEFDTTLLDRMMAERGAFARACIAAAKKLIARGAYTESLDMQKALLDIATNGDPIKSFVLECARVKVFVQSAENETFRRSTTDIFKAYTRYCQINRYKGVAMATMVERLKVNSDWRLTSGHTSSYRYIDGLTLNEYGESLLSEQTAVQTPYIVWKAEEERKKEEKEYRPASSQ